MDKKYFFNHNFYDEYIMKSYLILNNLRYLRSIPCLSSYDTLTRLIELFLRIKFLFLERGSF